MKPKIQNPKSKIETDPQSERLRILILEDVATDAELVKRELRNAGIVFTSRRVDKRDDFLKQLEGFSPDIILSDYTMPQFNGMEALALTRELNPTLPFVMVTGSINEETAVECMKAGADDYVLKERLKRIGSAVEGALEKKRMIGEKERAEDRLQEEKEFMEKSLNAQTDTFIVFEPATGKAVRWNKAFSEISGYSDEEIASMKVPDSYYSKEDLNNAAAATEKAFREGNARLEMSLITKDGRKILTEYSASTLEDKEGNPRYLIVIGRDITEQKQLEAQLIQSQKMEAIGQLAGGVAHDFNNLLTSIIGNATLVSMKLEKDSPLQEYPEEIMRAGNSAASLTRQLLAFSRRQIFQPEVLNLNAVIPNIEKMLRRLIGEDIELKTILQPELGSVETDPGQIEQIIVNLAVNARDAMPTGGKLTIETVNVQMDEAYALEHIAAKPGSYVMMAISDTGTGMDEEIRSRVFEPFFTTKEEGQGTGLGLSTVYGIVKQSDGYIWVYSEPGKGTTFKIYLPRVDKKSKDTKKIKTSIKSLSGTETVLVVEDNRMVRELAIKILQKYGYKVLGAKDGEEAIEIGKQHESPIDLMLTDVVMPGMSGRRLAVEFESLRPKIKVLYMSGYADNTVVHHGILDRGMVFIQKPFTHEALVSKVRDLLDGKKTS